MIKRILVPVLVLLCLLVSVAYAQDATDVQSKNALTQLTDLIFQVLTVVLPVVATWLAHRMIGVWESKTKVDIPLAVEKQIDEWVRKGIHYAEEKSRQKLAEKTGKLTGPEKLETAAKFVLDFVEKQGWTGWTADKIKAKIEASVNEKRDA